LLNVWAEWFTVREKNIAYHFVLNL
jgi:hypothetical protein